MDIRQLKYFVTVARCKNFTKAAQQLYISQPSLSKQISLLESEFGVQLLSRSNKQTTLTPAGELLYSYASTLINDYNQCLRVMNDYKSSPSGTIQLATLNAIETTFFPQFIQQFSKNYPNIQLTYITGNFSDLFSLIQSGSADVAVNLIPSHQEYANINVIRTDIASDQLVLIVSSNSSYADITSFEDPRINSLLNQSCYLFKGWHDYKPFLDLLQHYSHTPTIKYYENLPIFLLQTLNPSSYTVLPENFFDSSGGNKWYHKIPIPNAYSSLDLSIICQTNPSNPCVKPFLTELEIFFHSK